MTQSSAAAARRPSCTGSTSSTTGCRLQCRRSQAVKTQGRGSVGSAGARAILVSDECPASRRICSRSLRSGLSAKSETLVAVQSSNTGPAKDWMHCASMRCLSATLRSEIQGPHSLSSLSSKLTGKNVGPIFIQSTAENSYQMVSGSNTGIVGDESLDLFTHHRHTGGYLRNPVEKKDRLSDGVLHAYDSVP